MNKIIQIMNKLLLLLDTTVYKWVGVFVLIHQIFCFGSRFWNIRKQIIQKFYYRIEKSMNIENSCRQWGTYSNKEMRIVTKYRERIKQIQDKNISDKIVNSDTNSLDFYKITPKEELPKFLQKMRFQTLHFKEKDIAKSIKIFKKQNKRPEEIHIRNKLKQQGHLMLISEIYQHFDQPCESNKRNTAPNQIRPIQQTSDLQEWQKLRKEEELQIIKKLKREKSTEMRFSRYKDSKKEIQHKNNDLAASKQFKDGADYKNQIERALQIIEMTHSSENNMINRYMLIENSSKLLKKELDNKKMQLQVSIKSLMKHLYQARTEYHNFFQERNRLQLQQKLMTEQVSKEEKGRCSHKSLGSSFRIDKIEEQCCQKRDLIQINETKINKAKKAIQSLEQSITNLQQELKKVILAEKTYYKISLKIGNDVRESGLVWIIKNLHIKEKDMNSYEFPEYLDPKSRLFLIQKAMNEDQEDQLLQEKRKFVNQIGKSSVQTKSNNQSHTLTPKELFFNDHIIEGQFNFQSVPKKYRRSLKRITQLTQEYIINCSLLSDLKQNQRNKAEISADLDGMTNKQIYNQIGARIQKLDLSKLKKDKLTGSKNMRLIQYQNLLQKIKNIHIKLQEMDIEHEDHLLAHYQDNKDLYLMQAAACFGYKKAYSMIIKSFSWKTYHDAPK